MMTEVLKSGSSYIMYDIHTGLQYMLNPISSRQVVYDLKMYTNLYIKCIHIERVLFQLHGGVFGLLISCLEAEILAFKDM